MEKKMKPFQVPVSAKYGAPMGRRSSNAEDFQGKAHLQRVPFVDGDYDQGGAYWGGPATLWCAWDDHGAVIYVRADDRDAAKADEDLAGLLFYR